VLPSAPASTPFNRATATKRALFNRYYGLPVLIDHDVTGRYKKFSKRGRLFASFAWIMTMERHGEAQGKSEFSAPFPPFQKRKKCPSHGSAKLGAASGGTDWYATAATGAATWERTGARSG